MTTYTPSIEADLLLLNWYMDLGSGPDLEAAFSAELAPCAAFMSAMSRTLLVYEADERGIWAAAWFDRQMSAGLAGLWVREDKRHWGEGVRFIADALEFGLEHFPVLLFCAKNDNPGNVIAKAVSSFGFQILGQVPWLFDGDSATVGWCDAAHFQPAVEQVRAIIAAKVEARAEREARDG